jgi:hypothetical protein
MSNDSCGCTTGFWGGEDKTSACCSRAPLCNWESQKFSSSQLLLSQKISLKAK